MAFYRVVKKSNKTLDIRTRMPKDLEEQGQRAEYKKMKYIE